MGTGTPGVLHPLYPFDGTKEKIAKRDADSVTGVLYPFDGTKEEIIMRPPGCFGHRVLCPFDGIEEELGGCAVAIGRSVHSMGRRKSLPNGI